PTAWRASAWASRSAPQAGRPPPPMLSATSSAPGGPARRAPGRWRRGEPEGARAMLRTVAATRYVTPLREGGSVPAIVEADDDGLYVVKLLGAGHGRKALVAELITRELGRDLGP